MSTNSVKFVDLGLQFQRFKKQIMEKVENISSMGAYVLSSEVEEFEKNFAQFCGTKHALGVANGTDALILGLKARGIGHGDEVITAPNSFIATAGAISLLGAKPVFVDVGQDYNLDPAQLKSAITPQTKAIIPVHLTGMPADMDPINSIAKEHELFVIEDAAQAIGATYKQRKVGSLGDMATFSLHPLKNLHVQGDGGVITTNDTELFTKLRQLRNHGLKDRDTSEFWGYNSRLDAIQAGVANIKMPHLDEITKRFQDIAMKYHEGLANKVTVPELPEGRKGVFHNFVIMTEKRDELMAFLLEKGIETKIHYPVLLHLQPAAKELGYKKGDFPVAEAQVKKIVSLPIYPELTDEKVDYVIQSINDF